MHLDEFNGIIYNTNMSVVIDTNVIISGLQSNMGYSYKLLEMLPSNVFNICISVPLVLEYESQLKKHLSHEIFTDEDIDDFIDFICKIALKIHIYYLWRPYLKDPFDDHVLELAIASQSRYIVTFNKKDFRSAEKYGIEIVNPKEFFEILERRR